MGLDFIVAGRSHDSVLATSTALGVPSRVFDLVDEAVIDDSLVGITVLLNCAGPSQQTAKRLINACIRNRVHYLDTSAELISYDYAEQNDTAAKAAGVMLIPGCGGSTAMLGCLAARILDRIDGPVVSVDLALDVSGPMSRGLAITASQNIKAETLKRYDGALTSRKATDTALFDFGQGPVDCFPVTLPDLVTVHKVFGVPTIRTFAHASGTAFPSGDLEALPAGPTAEERRQSVRRRNIRHHSQWRRAARDATFCQRLYVYRHRIRGSCKACVSRAGGARFPNVCDSLRIRFRRLCCGRCSELNSVLVT